VSLEITPLGVEKWQASDLLDLYVIQRCGGSELRTRELVSERQVVDFTEDEPIGMSHCFVFCDHSTGRFEVHSHVGKFYNHVSDLE
jgi:hypothetical protein